MPRTRSLAWSELKIGLLTVSAIVMATVLIFLLGGEGGKSGHNRRHQDNDRPS